VGFVREIGLTGIERGFLFLKDFIYLFEREHEEEGAGEREKQSRLPAEQGA